MSDARQPQFSIVIPVFNRARFIETCLKSVIAQTFEDFEIIVSDDGSTDDLSSAVAEVKDSRISMVRQKKRGVASARNLGIKCARGRFVAFLDSDDRYLPYHLAKAHDILSKSPGLVVYSPVLMSRGEGRYLVKPSRSIRSDEDAATYLMCNRNVMHTSSLIVPVELAAKIGYNEDLSYSEDVDFVIRLQRAGAEFRMIGEPTAIVRDEPHLDRLSVTRDLASFDDWLSSMRPIIPPRAYYGYRGWHLAREVRRSNYLKGLAMCVSAIFRGCYPARDSVAVFLQVLLSDRSYRWVSDKIIGQPRLLRLAGFGQNDNR